MTDTMTFLAVWSVHWQVLEQLHLGGTSAALNRLSKDATHCSAVTGPDGHIWHVEQHGSHINHRRGFDVPFQQVRSTAVIAHTAARFTIADGQRLVALVDRLAEAQQRALPKPPRRMFRGYAMPWEAEADDQVRRVSKELHDLTRAVLRRDVEPPALFDLETA